jgi:hypothetical protein
MAYFLVALAALFVNFPLDFMSSEKNKTDSHRKTSADSRSNLGEARFE